MSSLQRESAASPSASRRSWLSALRLFEQPRTGRAVWQLVNTLVPYLALMAAMLGTVMAGWSYLITLALAVFAAAFMVRLFILFHDCCHDSFLPSPQARRFIGRILGVLVLTPFGEWRHAHLRHHATSGDLSRRGTGDITTMTVAEYLASSRWRRALYRAYRHPVVMFGVGPLFLFGLSYRIPRRGSSAARFVSVIGNDLVLAAILVLASVTVGLKTYLLVQIPVLFLAGLAGIWLFYVQHNFDPSYFAPPERWRVEAAALQGSSYYKLPRLLNWFSANIGIHHVHHLRPRIPNYNLQRCLDRPELRAPPLTLWRSLRTLSLDLWDEQACAFVSFRRALRSQGDGGRRRRSVSS